MYPATDLMQAKYDLLKPTNMTDYVANLWKEIHDDDEPPQEFQQKREQVLATLQKLGEDSQKVLSVLEDQEVVSALRQDKTQNLEYLKEHHGITLEDVNVLFKFGQFQYNVGNYGAAADLLYHFRILVCSV
jgi:translation initiation factor 3 subunit E